jgi:hypothetical protein
MKSDGCGLQMEILIRGWLAALHTLAPANVTREAESIVTHISSTSHPKLEITTEMPDLPSYDQHLLDRLNALKKSSIQIDSSK